MQKSNIWIVGLVLLIAVLAWVLLRDRGEEVAQKLDDFEAPSIYNTDPTPSPFEISDTGFIPSSSPTPSPSISPVITKGGVTPSPSPEASHTPVDTAVGDIDPTLIVTLTGGLSYLALKASRKLSVK